MASDAKRTQSKSERLLGLDLGGSSLKSCWLQDGRVLGKRRQEHSGCSLGFDELLELIAPLLEVADEGPGAPPRIGLAVPGHLDAKRRSIQFARHLPGLQGVDLVTDLERASGSPVIVDVDSNAGALGEALHGAGRGADRVLYVTLGTGLGLGMTIDGAPARVSYHVVGNAARVPLGDRGRAEELLSQAAFREVDLQSDPDGTPTPASVYEAARAGDARALEAWRDFGEDLARLLEILVPFVKPQRVVVGGGLAGAADMFLPHTNARLADRLPVDLRYAAETLAARLAPWSGAIGAALLAAR